MADEESKPAPAVTEEEDPSPPQPQAESDLSAITTTSPLDSTENKEVPPPPLPSELPVAEEVLVPAVEYLAVAEKEPLTPLPQATVEETDLQGKNSEDVAVVAQDEGSKAVEHRKIPQNLVSFKEESNKVADLSDSERRALDELKKQVREALDTHQFDFAAPKASQPNPKSEEPTSESKTKPPHEPKIEENPSKEADQVAKEAATSAASNEVSIWGVPLLKDDRSDVILLKFLRARDFKVKDVFVMLKNTIQWRKEFNIDALVDENLGDDLEKVVFMHGNDKEGHPVCYNVYGEFQNKELYQKTFSNEEQRTKFLRWRIQLLERSIRKLDFSPGGVCTIFQVNDLKNSPGPGKRDLRIATKQALQLLQDNYPEFVAKQVFINVPWWYLAFYTMISPFLTQRTKSKFVFASPSKSAEALFKYISPEQVPVQYGGLSVDYCDCNPEFSISDPVTEILIKPITKQTVEIIIYEKCVIVWELRVPDWEVSYNAEFKPDAKDGYTAIIQKTTKMYPSDAPVVSSSFKVGEPGKILLTIDNPTTKKKRLLYRFKVNPYSDRGYKSVI